MSRLGGVSTQTFMDERQDHGHGHSYRRGNTLQPRAICPGTPTSTTSLFDARLCPLAGHTLQAQCRVLVPVIRQRGRSPQRGALYRSDNGAYPSAYKATPRPASTAIISPSIHLDNIAIGYRKVLLSNRCTTNFHSTVSIV